MGKGETTTEILTYSFINKEIVEETVIVDLDSLYIIPIMENGNRALIPMTNLVAESTMATTSYASPEEDKSLWQKFLDFLFGSRAREPINEDYAGVGYFPSPSN